MPVILRRAFYYALFAAVPLLPAWVLIGWGVFGHGGWGFLGLVIATPVMFLALLIVALLVYARPTVRKERAVSWVDTGILALWYACLIGFGFFGDTTTLFAVLGVLAALTAFWLSLWQLLADSARSVRATMEEFERQAAAPGVPQQPRPYRPGPDDDVIIIHEVRD